MTIKDIARESGYAVGTVSRVLNNHPDVSEKARERILAVVAKNGYTQNANAKNLKQSVNRSLLVLVKGVRNELFAALVEQLQGLVNNTPYTLLVDYFDEDTDEVQRAIALCAEKKPQGILFLGGNADNFKRSFGRITLPAVLVTSPAEGLDYPNLSSVTTDDFEASVQAVRVLLEHGHRHIAIIGGRPSFSDVSGQRFAGGRAAFAQSGLPAENLVEYGEARFCYEEGYQAMHHVLEEHPEITAAYAIADVVAIGAMRAAQDTGRTVGKDLSIIGFDGLALGEYLTPRLATIGQSVERLAREATGTLLDAIENGAPARRVTVPFTVISGESVGLGPGAQAKM